MCSCPWRSEAVLTRLPVSFGGDPRPPPSERSPRDGFRSNGPKLFFDGPVIGTGVTVPAMACTARGTFDIQMTPSAPELGGVANRLEFTKTFSGDLDGVGAGLMLSGGDPQKGEAGYVAIETVSGRLGDKRGSFAMQQFGTMHAGSQTLHYEVVPGSGRDALEGITGSLQLTIDEDGTHRYELQYQV